MKLLHITAFVMCFAFIVNAIPIPDEESATEIAILEDEASKSSEESAQTVEAKKEPVPVVIEETIQRTKKTQLKQDKKERNGKKVIAKDSVLAETKAISTVARAETPKSNPSEMHIKAWGPNDYEYSFETSNQRQAKTIHIEDEAENEDNTYNISDKGSFSSYNDEHGYESKVEYTAGIDGYRPKVSFSFHS